jgi:D-alanyl-D-alanine carboxypeptidase
MVQRMAFSNNCDGVRRAAPIAGRRLQSLLLLLSALLLAACGQQGGSQYGPAPYGESRSFAPTHYYPPPGPPDDPWGPYLGEAATRYGVPEQWIRAVMHQESDGQEQAVSSAGAMGLMQVMPATYQGLRVRYGLGDDPYDPHNNILAGTGYIREMYDRYGAPGFLAAYNAGPDRVDGYLAGASPLPDETVNYLAAVTPNLGNTVPLSGPLARYASSRSTGVVATIPGITSLAAGCDLNAAYDPNHPCTSLERAATVSAPLQALVQQEGTNGCDLNAAYDPGHPCTSQGQAAASAPPLQQASVQQDGASGCDPNAAYDPDHLCRPAPSTLPHTQLASTDSCDPNLAFNPDRPCHAVSAADGTASTPTAAQPVSAVISPNLYQPAAPPGSRPFPSAEPGGAQPHLLAIPVRDWAIQVGAFANPALARAVAEGARAEAPDQLRSAALALPPTPYGGSVLYRARLVHLSASAAADACTQLNRRQLPCVVVQPSRS